MKTIAALKALAIVFAGLTGFSVLFCFTILLINPGYDFGFPGAGNGGVHDVSAPTQFLTLLLGLAFIAIGRKLKTGE